MTACRNSDADGLEAALPECGTLREFEWPAHDWFVFHDTHKKLWRIRRLSDLSGVCEWPQGPGVELTFLDGTSCVTTTYDVQGFCGLVLKNEGLSEIIDADWATDR